VTPRGFRDLRSLPPPRVSTGIAFPVERISKKLLSSESRNRLLTFSLSTLPPRIPPNQVGRLGSSVVGLFVGRVGDRCLDHDAQTQRIIRQFERKHLLCGAAAIPKSLVSKSRALCRRQVCSRMSLEPKPIARPDRLAAWRVGAPHFWNFRLPGLG
jgi:hypothetical protein